jgi:hypothetical protein
MNDENKQKVTTPHKRSRLDQDEDGDRQMEEQQTHNKKTVITQPLLPWIKQLDCIKHWAQTRTDDDEYMVALPWYITWEKKCMGWASQLPGKIDNSSLFQEDGTLREDMEFNKDYKLVPEKGWGYLVKW